MSEERLGSKCVIFYASQNLGNEKQTKKYKKSRRSNLFILYLLGVEGSLVGAVGWGHVLRNNWVHRFFFPPRYSHF